MNDNIPLGVTLLFDSFGLYFGEPIVVGPCKGVRVSRGILVRVADRGATVGTVCGVSHRSH